MTPSLHPSRFLVAVLLVACGGPPAPAPTTAARGATLAWHDMSHDQRRDYMKRVVFPRMRGEFVAFDAARFGAMTCATCHGDGATDGSFKMPNPKLPALAETRDFFAKLFTDKPAIAHFMMEKVKVDMAGLLGESPYDPATRRGFGCFECHPRAQ